MEEEDERDEEMLRKLGGTLDVLKLPDAQPAWQVENQNRQEGDTRAKPNSESSDWHGGVGACS